MFICSFIHCRSVLVPTQPYQSTVRAKPIIATGIGIFKDTMNGLLGAPASPETVNEIESDILSYEGVIGVHDLMVHVMENPSLTEFFYERDGEIWKKRII